MNNKLTLEQINGLGETTEFRYKMAKKGFDLVNITPLIEVKLGTSGLCNGLNEPEESCHFIQLYYRDDIVAQMGPSKLDVLDDDQYVALTVFPDDYVLSDFIIFRKVPLTKEQQKDLVQQYKSHIKRMKHVSKNKW